MRTALLVICLASLSACASAPGPQPVNQTPAKASGAGAGSGAPSAPHAAAPGTAEASSDAPDQPLDDKVAELKSAYEKNPSDASAKKALADATFQNAQFYMYKSPLPPNQKYPKALTLYREVLKLDPSNSAAQDSVDMIESIYRQMGRPVPEA
jgi:tetratricopeptide (TPR) repeat protein